MKISAKIARKKIKSGNAWVEGKMSTGHSYPEGDEYWIITDAAEMETHHVLVGDAPRLNKTKATATATA